MIVLLIYFTYVRAHVDGAALQCNDNAKCLGYIWSSTLSSKPMIEYNITKARRSFFAYGSIGAYQGAISPLSCRSLIETCVMPVLLYGCECWSLCDSSLKALNSFLGELCKRVPKWYSNTASMIFMDCQSAEARCLTRKLCFLHRITNSSDTLSSQTLVALSDDIESVCLIQECLELEEHLKMNLTRSLLISNSDSDRPSTTQIKNQVTSSNRSLLLEKCSQKEDTKIVADIARLVSWSKLWDLAHNEGPNCVNALRMFVRIISYPTYSTRACPMCDIDSLDCSLLSHTLRSHVSTHTSVDASDILNSLRAAVTIPVPDPNGQDPGSPIDSTNSVECETTSSSIRLDSSSCLLYTSPSPRDATLSRMPSSA